MSFWSGAFVALGLSTGAFAADLGEKPFDPSATITPLAAGPFDTKKVEEVVTGKSEEEKTDAEKRAEERLKQLEASQGTKNSRVVVLEWAGTDTDYSNETLTRTIKTRIARPSAKFYPEIDLYQSGRKEPDLSVRPLDQRASVPDSAIEAINQAAAEVEPISFSALDDEQWGVLAVSLREKLNLVWFIDRPQLREPLFRIYMMIGYAAENRNDSSPPFYEFIGRRTVNYYWYLAGSMAHEDPTLLSKVSNAEMHANVSTYKDAIDNGDIGKIPLSFELEGQWDAAKFTSEYEVFINGRPLGAITDPKGLYPVPPGRTDVYIKRGDGHSLSDRVDLDKLQDKVYFVRDVARKRMGIDFIDQLMEHPNECTPEVDGDILVYLSIYQTLHKGSEIYIAVPVAGSTHKIELWRWKSATATLEKVQDNTGGFPVRFAVMLGSGLGFGGVTAKTADESSADITAAANNIQPGVTPSPADAAALASGLIPKPDPRSVPIAYELRGHYGRLMFVGNANFSLNIKDGSWEEVYQTKGTQAADDRVAARRLSSIQQVAAGESTPEDEQEGGNVIVDLEGDTYFVGQEVHETKQLTFQRLLALGVGVMLGKDAAYGLGPRGYLRTGIYNAPHAVDMTAHLGYTTELPSKKEPGSGRVIGIADIDVFGGAAVPFRNSLSTYGTTIYYANTSGFNPDDPDWQLGIDGGVNKNGDPKKLGNPIPAFGFTLSAGLTF